MNQSFSPPPAVPDVPTGATSEPIAWLGGYFIEASVGRLRVEAVISPGGRLVSLAEASARPLHDGDLALIEFFAAEMADAGIDGPHVVDLIATLPEDSQAGRLLAAMWEQHPENRPEPTLAPASRSDLVQAARDLAVAIDPSLSLGGAS